MVPAIALLAGSLLPGPAAADSAAAVTDSTAAPPAASTAVDTARTVRKEFPHPDSTLVPRLRSGGYVIVFRHSITDWAQRDADAENFEDRSTQRNLSKEGEVQAARIGKAIAELRLPIGTVLSSPMWRCRDTAQIAFGHHQAVPELFRRGPEYRAMRIVLLGSEPEEGKDMVLVTHQDLLIPIVEGLRRDQLKEGDAFVVKPLGEGAFEIVAQVTPEDWERLAADDKATVAKNGKSTKSTKTAKK
ncbi:MAG TPA: histidine phosphatase family protein [Candidatus Eisenbacteria bacterium]